MEVIENNVLSVGFENRGKYFLWSRGLTPEAGDSDGVYFEFDDQSNGGYEITSKTVISTHGVEVHLTTGEILSLQFPEALTKSEKFASALQKVYQGRQHVLQIVT